MTGRLALCDAATPNQVRELPAWLGGIWIEVHNDRAAHGADDGQAQRAAWKAVRRAATAKRKNEMIDMSDLLNKMLGRPAAEKAAEPEGGAPDPDLSVLPPELAEAILRRQETSAAAAEKTVNLRQLSQFVSSEFGRLYPGWWVTEVYDTSLVAMGSASETEEEEEQEDGQGSIPGWRRVPILSIDVAEVAGEQVVLGVEFGGPDTWVRVVPVFAELTVLKEASGRERWVTISSGGFEDRDGEVVSTGFLRSCVALADRTKERGPLRIFHIPGADVGGCDFQAVIGEPGFLLESGLFDQTPAGEKAAAYYAEHAGEYGCSIKFLYVNRTDDGVYLAPGVIVERSLLPRGKAAFPWSALSLSEVAKMAQLDDAKRAELERVLGNDLAAVVLGQLEESAKALAGAGIRFKEVVEADAAEAAAGQDAQTDGPDGAAPAAEGEGEKALAGQPEAPQAFEVVLEPEVLASVAEQATASIAAQIPELVTAQMQPMTDNLNALQAVVEKLAGDVAALARSDDAKVAEKVANLPRATVRLAQGMHRPTAVAKEEAGAAANGAAGEPVDYLAQLMKTVHGS